MIGQRLAGVLRTTAYQAEDVQGWFGAESVRCWDVIPGVSMRNDGVYPAVLVPGYVYRLQHDGIGWQLTPEGDRPHAYLVDGNGAPVESLELAHRPLVLMRDHSYVVSRDETGAWLLNEQVTAAAGVEAGEFELR
jgi:hypothetical protein